MLVSVTLLGASAQKLAELGAKAVTLSGPDGYIYDPDGVVTEEKIQLHAGDESIWT